MDFLRAHPSRSALVAAVLAIGVGLTGCSGGQGSTNPSATPSASSSPATEPSLAPDLSGIKVEGDYGKQPTVTFQPFTIAETQSKALVEGKGRTVTATDTVKVHYLGVNGRTGQPFDSSYPSGQPVAFPLNGVVPGFSKGLVGKKEGSRVLIAMPGKDGYDSGGGNPQAGIQVGDTLVFVVDIMGFQLTEPQGKAVTQPAGQPTISGATNDPQVKVPAGAPPKNLLVQPLIKGEGPQVTEKSTITVNYRAWLWNGGTKVDDSYATRPDTGQLSTLIPGWSEGLKGQTVGSRVLLVIPPDKAYPEGVPEASVPAGATLIYVVDILDAS
ncbi:peptidylprolyl isomerase [Raineyella antarctica]|uniref:peptidylprolyl isomerase n=1 Tax=Raineyella antarctica TaxID=1577474 RepID=A0A1G6GRT0_9ACTN|nr:FKBP-type peptidyl-prolyl cis-trans isomerase [Raineyella antarctica]SDB84700.1 peptidylprolyl isomerase [Raineyella antarctica]